MRVKNGARWLTACLEAQYFCDHIIVLDDNSTDATAGICRQMGVEYYRKPFDAGYDEGTDREILAVMATAYNPEWICSMDADEVLMADTWDKIKGPICDPSVPVIEILNLNLWDEPDQVRTDEPWGNQYRQRFWRFKSGKLTYAADHCSLPNEITERPFTRTGAMLHYGYMKSGDRIRRYDRYRNMGHNWPTIIQTEGIILTPLADVCAKL